MEKEMNEWHEMVRAPFDFYVPKVTHNVTIRSRISKESDSKTFSINAKQLECAEIAQCIESFAKSDLKVHLEDKVEFNFGSKKTYSHVVIIYPKNGSKGPSKSFMLAAHNYSSEEIAREFCKFLCDGRCDF